MRRRVGRYVVLDLLASGGMASVHLGRLRGEAGFHRLVAVKILRQELARDPEARTMFMDEARIVSGIRHPNVVQTLDVLEDQGDLFLVMDYVDGVPVSHIMRDVLGAGGQLPIPVVMAIVGDMLEGLHAAHEARGEDGAPLSIVHRDVSPQNVMVSRGGTALVVDFGIARAADRGHLTTPGQIKGKAAYMAPEQAQGGAIDRRVDLYAAAIIAWELLTGARLFAGDSFAESILKQLEMVPPPPSTRRPDVAAGVDAVLLRALAKRPADRFATAHEMVVALEAAAPRATRAEVGAFVGSVEADFYRQRDEMVARASRELAEPPPVLEQPAAAEATTREPTRRDATPSRRYRPWVGAVTLVLGGIAAGALALVLHVRSGTSRTSAPPAAQSTGSVASAPTAAAARDDAADAGTPRPATLVAAAASSAPPPRAPSSSRPAARPPSPVHAASSAPVALPPCCAGGIQIRFSGCRDNCQG